MFVSWGSKTVDKAVGGARMDCPICGQERDFTTVANYTVSHFCYMFRWATSPKYRAHCHTCQGAVNIPARVVEAELKKPVVSVFDRRGWAMALAGVTVLIAGGLVAGEIGKQRDIASLEDPHVGDILAIDLANVFEEPEAYVMYSAIRVTDVNANEIEVALPRQYANQLSLIRTDVSAGKARRDDYYTDERMVISRAVLQEMRKNGTLLGVWTNQMPGGGSIVTVQPVVTK